MNEDRIKERLESDIQILREPEYGYIRAGLPRFPALFGRDSCITAWQLIDYDISVARDTLEILARLQGKKVDAAHEEEPGKILHEWHPHPEEYKKVPWPLPYYGSVDVTSLFVFLCGLYYEKTRDFKWLERMWPNLEAALEWCERSGDTDGDMFLDYEQTNPTGLRHKGWKDRHIDHLKIAAPVELVEVQGYYYIALRIVAILAAVLKKQKLSTQYISRKRALRDAFIEKFWFPEKSIFAFALNGKHKADMRITSNMGHLLFTGILDGKEEMVAALVERLFREDMWTPWGIRTHAQSNPDFDAASYHLGSVWPHDNWVIAQGLKRYGYIKEYDEIRGALLRAYETLGDIPELYVVRNGSLERSEISCSPQAWATGALLNFLTQHE